MDSIIGSDRLRQDIAMAAHTGGTALERLAAQLNVLRAHGLIGPGAGDAAPAWLDDIALRFELITDDAEAERHAQAITRWVQQLAPLT